MTDATGKEVTEYDGEISLPDIIKNEKPDFLEDSFYVCDLSDVIRQYDKWLTHMPRVAPFYAMKCNSHPTILKLLATLGTGFDCASKGEISMVLSLGVTPDKIIYANPTKSISHLIYAVENGVTTITFDNDFELFKIKKHSPEASLLLRIKCEAAKAQCPLGEKFGCDPIDDGPRLISLAKSLDLKVVGVCFHVGSGCEDLPAYGRAIEKSKTLFDYARTIGYNFALLDIGGGFLGEKGTSIEEVGNIVSSALDKYFPEEDGVKIIAEPGRFFVTSAYTLVCKIHSKRKVKEGDELRKIMYYINDGVYGSFLSVIFDQNIASPKWIPSDKKATYKSTIWGHTCDAFDMVFDNILLPDLNIGDFLIFEDMGAYTVVLASSFNGFSIPTIKFFIDAKDKRTIALQTAEETVCSTCDCNKLSINSDDTDSRSRSSNITHLQKLPPLQMAAGCEHSFFNKILEMLWNILLCL